MLLEAWLEELLTESGREPAMARTPRGGHVNPGGPGSWTGAGR
jgi:hypothetical protein